MPMKCSVPGCKTNYSHSIAYGKRDRLPTFSLPKDPQRRDFWLSIIPGMGNGFNPTKWTRVCRKHFLDKFVRKPTSRSVRNRKVRKRIRVSLYNDAYPTIFPDFATKSTTKSKAELSQNKNEVNKPFRDDELEPATLSNDSYSRIFSKATSAELSLSPNENGVKNKTPERRLLDNVCNGSKTEIDNWVSTDKVTDFPSFCKEAENYLEFTGDKWICESNKEQELESIRFSLLQQEQDVPHNTYQYKSCDPRPIFTVTVSADMYVRVHSKISGDIPESCMSWIFGNQCPPVLVYWSQFVTIICQCSIGFWIDHNDFDPNVCINDLHELPPLEKEDQAIQSSVGDTGDVGETLPIHASDVNGTGTDVTVDENDNNNNNDNDEKLRDEIQLQQLTQNLYSAIYQRNLLMKKMKNIQDLASINLDILSLSLIMNSEGKEEMEKVHRLVQTIMSHAEEMNAGLEVLPVWMKENPELMEKGDILQLKFPSFQDNSPLGDDCGEMNGKHHNRDGDSNVDGQSSVDGPGSENVEENDDGVDDSEMSMESSQPLDDNEQVKGLTCEYCQNGRRFISLRALRSHQYTSHKIRLSSKCNICGKQSKNHFKSLLHMKTHSQERPFQCAICGITFKCKSSLSKHEKTYHTEERPHVCPVCGARFKRNDCMMSHLARHRKKGNVVGGEQRKRWMDYKRADNLYHCDVCDKVFVKSTLLKLHMVHHSDANPFQCSLCGKSYKRRVSLKNHKLVHQVERPYECSLCDKKFKKRYILKDHQSVHAEQGEYACDICEKRFKWRRSLKKHRACHEEEVELYQCSSCLQKFKQKEDLAAHELTHKVSDKLM